MVAGAFNHRHRAGIAHRKAFAGHAFEIRLTGNRAIQHGVADDNVLRRMPAQPGRLAHHHPPARQPLADIVIAVAGQLQRHAAGQEGAEAAAGRAGEANGDGVVRQPGMAVFLRNLPGQHGADGAIEVADRLFQPHRLAVLHRRGAFHDQFAVHGLFQVMFLELAMADRHTWGRHHLVQQLAEIDAFGLPMRDRRLGVQPVHLPDHLLKAAEAQLGHNLAHFLGDEEQVVDHVFRRAGKARPQHRVLCRNAHRAGVQMAFAHHDAAGRDQRAGGEAELIGPQQRAHHHVPPGAQAAIHLHHNPPAQPVQHQGLLGFRQPDFPRRPGMGQRGQRACASATFVAGNRHMVGAALGHPRRHGANAHFGHQLDRNPRLRVHVLQIVDQLRQIFDRVDIVMRRRRNQPHARGRMPHPGNVLVHLMARQLSAFTRLRALRHLDLDVVGIDQVFRRHAKPARGHLLNGRTFTVAVRQLHVAIGFLAALAGVRPAADAVHRHRQGRMRLAADRAEAHRAGGEPLDDLLRRLNLVERNRRRRQAELHQPANGQQPLVLLVDVAGEITIPVLRVAAHGVLQVADAFRRPGMVLAAQAEGVVAAHIQHFRVNRIAAIGLRMPLHRLGGNLGHAGAFDAGRGAGEAFFDKGAGQANRVENLRPAIGLVGGNAHLGHHLQHPLANRLDEVLARFIRADLQPVIHPQLLDGLERQIRVDRLGAIAGQGAEMMHFPRLTGFHHQPRIGAQALTDQVMMHGSGRQQRRNGDAVGGHAAIGNHQNVEPVQHGVRRLVAQIRQRPFHPGRALAGRPAGIQRAGAEPPADLAGNRPDLRQIAIGQDRLAHFQPVMRALGVAQQVRPRPDHGHQRHHQLLAGAVDRRVGHLGEVLLEVVVQQLRLAAQHRNRRIGAHGAERIVAQHRHRLQEELHVLLGVAKRLLHVQPGGAVIRRVNRQAVRQFRQFFELDLRRLQPFLVRMVRRQLGLDFVVVDNPAFFEVDQQHLARLQAPFAHDAAFRHRQHAGFGCQDHMVIIGHHIARRAQPVAIQRGANLPPIGKCDRGRAIPRFHQRGMIFVERPPFRVHQRVARPGFRDQHHHRMRQRVATGQQNFQRIIQARRVGLAMRDQRPHFVQIRPEQVRGHRATPREHPVHVAAHGVDLTVMRHEAIRMRQPPGREGVGRKPLMHQRQRRFRQRVLQVQIEAAHLRRQQQALIDQGAGGAGRHVQFRQARQPALHAQIAHIVQHLLSDGQDLALKRVLIGHIRATGDDRLPDVRHRLDHLFAQSGQIGRHSPPAEEALPLQRGNPLHQLHRIVARRLVARQEAHRHRVMAGLRQAEAQPLGPMAQQFVGDLNQAASAVTHQRVRADRAAMIQVHQDLQPAPDQFVRFSALDIRHEANAAGVVLQGRIIEALRLRRALTHGLIDHGHVHRGQVHSIKFPQTTAVLLSNADARAAAVAVQQFSAYHTALPRLSHDSTIPHPAGGARAQYYCARTRNPGSGAAVDG